jgi:PIN domain nuclease of toxin-antitoxin system
MASVVFDSSAILALLRDEPGADAVARHIGDGIISAVNFQEIIKELLRRGVPTEAALDLLDALHLDVRAHGRNEAIAAANLYLATKQYGSGLGDRTCMALAIAESLPAITADQAWSNVEVAGLQVQLIRGTQTK